MSEPLDHADNPDECVRCNPCIDPECPRRYENHVAHAPYAPGREQRPPATGPDPRTITGIIVHDQPIQRDTPLNDCDAWDTCRMDEECGNFLHCLRAEEREQRARGE